MEELKTKCLKQGLTVRDEYSAQNLQTLLESEILSIGTSWKLISDKWPIVEMKTRGENLEWISLVVKKKLPKEKFSKIYIEQSSLLLNEECVDLRAFHAILRVLKKEGVLYIRGPTDELHSRLVKEDLKFIKTVGVGPLEFETYSRVTPKVKFSRVRKPPGEYELLDLESAPIETKNLCITLGQFLGELENRVFLENFTLSIKHLLSYKKEFYLERKTDIQKKFRSLQKKIRYVRTKGVSMTTVREMYPMYDFYAGFLFELEEMIAHITHLEESTDPSQVKENLTRAIYDADRGLASLVGRDNIKDRLVSHLYAFSRNWKVFSGNFCNFALMGVSGSGKTRVGQVISFVFAMSGILATDQIHIVSRSDLVRQYIGQTAPRTRSLLLASLEGVLFIDEAYQLATGDGKDFGHESITEIVNFLDKYVGMSVVIVAGYRGIMKEKFFPSNEGLERRFPHQITLEPYSVPQLTDILVNFIERTTPLTLCKRTQNILFTMVTRANRNHPQAFNKQAGDMLNLGGAIVTAIYSSYKIKWDSSNFHSTQRILKSAFDKFLRIKGCQNIGGY